ncbi:MAG: periplasmic heavy metal sensor [Proteobacteria bacterium]|nr:periplasmic heavy metal sensor [Pseudomonadota bacterium]
MTVNVDQARPAGPPRYLYPSFIASLALNLLFIGLFATAVWHHHEEDKTRNRGFLGFVSQLPPDTQAEIRQQVLEKRAAMKGLRENIRKTWVDANAMLTEEPFDKAKFLAALMQLRTAEDAFKGAIYNAVADTAVQLTPDQRKLLQEWREKRHAFMLNRHGPPDGDKPK